MSSLIYKVIKWILSMSALICAIAFMGIYGDTGDMKYMAVIVPCLAVVFWLSKSTYEASKPVMVKGFGVLAVGGIIAYFGQSYIAPYLDTGFFMTWEILMLILGIPVMFVAFKKDD